MSGDPIAEWFLEIGGSTAQDRWSDLEEVVGRASDRDDSRYIASATALLENCRAVAACCGDKSALRDRKSAYYELFYEYAKPRPGLSVVRIFPGGRDEPERARHNLRERRGVLGIVATTESNEWTGDPLNLGFVLFRHSDLHSALIHWSGQLGFTWRVTSDPLLTLVMRDWWGSLLTRARVEEAEEQKALAPGSVRSFIERFGIRVPKDLR